MWAFARVSFTDESLSVRITVPDAELESLSFCDPDPVALSDWVGGLPMANTSDTATQIRQATFEICRLVIDFPQRMELLEGLRPSLHYLMRTARPQRNQHEHPWRLDRPSCTTPADQPLLWLQGSDPGRSAGGS